MAEVGNIPRLTVDPLSPHPRTKTRSKKLEPSLPIGIFDSGVGGLTVLSQILQQLPHEDIIYLADTARVPFGGRPHADILKINHEIFKYFSKQGVKLVVMACGTSSAIAYPKIRDQYKFPIVAMIEPGCRAALAATKNKKVGLIATQNTVDSGAFQDKLIEMDKKIQVIAAACPLFVPLIEGGFIQAQETRKVAEEYFRPLIKQGIDTLILGCTHYPHLSPILGDIIKAELVDPANEVVKEVRLVLAKEHLLKTTAASTEIKYVTTADPLKFEELGTKLIGRAIGNVKLVDLR